MTTESNPEPSRRFLAFPPRVVWMVIGSATLVIAFTAWSVCETATKASSNGTKDPPYPNRFGSGRTLRHSAQRGLGQTNPGGSTPIEAWSRALATTLGTIESEADPLERERRLDLASAKIDDRDIPAALELLRLQSGLASAGALGIRLMHRWAESDTLSAADWVRALPANPWRNEAMNIVAITWANRDLGAVVAWARELPEEADQLRSLQAVADEAVRSHPVESLQLAVDLPADRKSDGVILRATSEWAARDASGAANWARQIEDGILRQEVLAGIATAWAETDPQSAAFVVSEELSPGSLQSNAVVCVAQRWAQQEPEAAASWVERFPVGELKRVAIENVAAQWALQNPGKAGKWQKQMAMTE
jgi:hypothetical protein